MTELEHAIVGYIVLTIIWHAFLKQHFITKKDRRRYRKIMNEYFFGE